MADKREKQSEDLEAKLKKDPDFDPDAILARLEKKEARRLAELRSPKAETAEAEKTAAKKEVPPPPNLPVEEPVKAEAEKKPKPGEFEVLEEEVIEHAPAYQPKILTPEFLRTEEDVLKIRTAFTDEGRELEKVDARTKIEFWRYLLSVLKKENVEYDYKKTLVEDYLQHEEHQPKIVTPGFLHTEDDMFKIVTAFRDEAEEMETKKVDAQTRIDFWQHTLSILKKWDPEYEQKKNFIEAQIEQAKSEIASKELEAGLERGEREMEAELGPRHEPKFLTLKKFREEKDMNKFLEALRFEDGELDTQKVGWDQRIEFWQRLLSGLESAHPLHGAKEMAVKVRLERAKSQKNFEESLARGTEEFIEKSEEAKEAKFASRVLDIMNAEGVDEAEARKRAEQEMKDGEVRDGKKKEKLEKLKEARERLAAAEKNKKAYEGLVGRLKSWIKKGDKKSEAEVEYDAAAKDYKTARAEYVAGSAERMLQERGDLADARARELYEKRGKIYRAWKWLGDQNVEKLMPEKFKAKLAAWRPEGKLGRAAKFAARLGTKFLSLRTGVSFGLLGVGIWGGVGTAAAVSLLAARRAIGGLGAGFGTYDLMRRGQESWAVTKWNLSWKPWEMKAGLTKDDVEKLSEEELEERMTHFEMNSALGNSKVSENEIYKLLTERYKEVVEGKAEMKGADAMKFLEAQMEGADDKLKELKTKAKRNDRIMKGVAMGMGLVAGSGLISKLIRGKWGWEQFAEARETKQELRQQIGQAPEVPAEAPPVGPVEAAVSPDFSVEDVAGRVNFPKEFIAQLAGPDGKLTFDEVTEIDTLRRHLELLGLDPQDAELIKGLHIEKISDIAEAEANLEALRQATSEAPIAREVITHGLDEGDAGQLRSATAAVTRAELTPEARQAVIQGAVENNFENTPEMARILEKVDADHLREAGILKPDGTYDRTKLLEIVNAHTIAIDQRGEGIYKALRDYYSAPPERGGLGLSGRELRAKIVEQMKNQAFFKGGKLQDLVEIGDQIRVDNRGNVLLFVAEDGRMARTRDILDLVSERAFRSGNRVFEVAPGVHLREALHPIDGHAVIKLTDAQGVTHTISDWSVGRTARIDGHKEVLEDWLERNNLLAGARGATPAIPPEELGGASQVRHEILVDESRRLRDGYESLAEAHEAHHDAAAAAAEEQISAVEESTGISPETAAASGEAVVSGLESQVMEHAAAYDNALPHYGIDIRVEDIANMSPEELQGVDAELGEVLEGMPETGVSDENLRFREALQTLRDYLQEQLERGGGTSVAAAVETSASVSEVLRSGQPAQFGDAQISFRYDVFGNPSGVNVVGTASSLRAESLLHADWAAKLETTAVGDLDGARTDVMSTARELEMRERLLEGLERSGLGQSPEAEFLRKSTKMLIENTEENYGDVFRD